MLAADVAKLWWLKVRRGWILCILWARNGCIEDEGIAGPHAHRSKYEVSKFSSIGACEVPE